MKDLILKNRSYRRFNSNCKIEEKYLLDWVELARLSSSARNAQPLKYLLSNTEEKNDKIFPALSWAGYLKDWNSPEKHEQPTAYIVVLGDSTLAHKFDIDSGIAAQSILLGAVSQSFGGCIIAAVKKDELRKQLNIPANLQIIFVIALGKPVEEVKIEEMKDGNIKYYRTEDKVHHVPKRSLSELIIK